MSSISSHSSNFQAQPPDLTTQLRVRISTLENENQQLKQQLLWEDKLFANPNLSPSHKLALRTAVYTIRKTDHSPDGLTKIFIPALAEKTGLSPKTVGKNLQFLADTGALIREADTQTDKYGQKITRVYIGLTDQIKKPETIQPSKPRNHGGFRSFCPSCGSENLIEEKKIICTDCGTVVSKTQRLVNPDPIGVNPDPPDDGYSLAPPDGQDDLRYNEDETAQPADNLSLLKNQKEPEDNLTVGYQKPTTPPKLEASSVPTIITSPMSPEQEHTLLLGEQAKRPEQELQRAAELLLEMAGDQPEYIVMNTNPDINKKYLTVHRQLTLEDLCLHLAGRKTLGATLTHADGTTRALCFDVDDNPTDSVSWSDLETSAGYLYASGYKPLLEPSPAGRGGHLWLIFSERVNAEAAYNQVCALSPELKDITEHWPSGGKQKVRLPAGKYVTPTFAKWTTLYDANHNELVKNETKAARILLTSFTPADLIPEVVPASKPAPNETQKPEQSPQRQHHQSATSIPDLKHQQKYGKHQMWVEWQDETYLIQRFNADHTIDDLAIFERSGMINASQIGRPERTASVGVTRDGERFTDFGKGARKEDGTQDGGDPFEFYIRSRHLEKSEVLREFGQQLNKVASSEILRAAKAGELPPAWVMEILTDKGREIYNENAQSRGHPPLEEHLRGVVGFSKLGEVEQTLEQDSPYPPPRRACIQCGVVAWQWVGEKYICGNTYHPPTNAD